MSNPTIVEAPLPFVERMVQAFPGGIAYLDSSLVFRFCNAVQASYFGHSVEEVIGRSLHEVTPENPHFWLEIERVLQSGDQYPQTALAVTWTDRPAEGEHHYLVSYIADLDGGGGVRGVFMTALEVTESIVHDRDIERELRQRNQVLEETVRERDVLVGIISHELRTPLTTIFGNAHMLLRRLEDMDEDSRTRAINDIREEAARLTRLVENMLQLARAGVQDAVPTEPVLVGRALSEVVSQHEGQFRSRLIRFNVKPEGLMADAQPEYMKQVAQNLLSNAEKYSPVDRPIDVRVRRGSGGVIISILDRGPGVAAAESEMIFQPFYRSSLTSTKVRGAGIGLAVCKLLVQAQSGRIWWRPRRGGGSVFSFSVPLAASTSDTR